MIQKPDWYFGRYRPTFRQNILEEIFMIIIGEKINGTIPVVKKAIEARDVAFIQKRAIDQAEAGASFIDVCASVDAEREKEVLTWLINIVQDVTDVPLAIDSPNEDLLAEIYTLAKRPGLFNSVNEEGTKCETIFPLMTGNEWEVIGLTCDKEHGIPMDVETKVDIAKRIIDKGAKYGVEPHRIHIDPAVMALATAPEAMKNFEQCIMKIKQYAPTVKITGAISNISYEMPVRKIINQACMTMAIRAGLDSAIMDPLDREMMSMIYAAEALSGKDKSGRKYNMAYRKGKIGTIKK